MGTNVVVRFSGYITLLLVVLNKKTESLPLKSEQIDTKPKIVFSLRNNHRMLFTEKSMAELFGLMLL